MKKILITLASLSTLLSALTIEGIYMATEVTNQNGTYNIKKTTERFDPNQPVIHALFKYSHASTQKDKVLVKWICEDGVQEPDYEITQITLPLTLRSGVLHASFQRGEGPLPKGHYRVEAYLRGKKIAQKQFTVGLISGNTPPAQSTVSGKITRLIFSSYVGLTKENYLSPEGVSDTFAPTQKEIYLTVVYKGFATPGQLKFLWYVDQAGDKHNALILTDTLEITLPDGAVYDKIISQDGAWPSGIFRVDILYQGQKLGSKRFTIAPTPAEASTASGHTFSSIDDLLSSQWIDNSQSKPLVITFPSRTQIDYGGTLLPCTIDSQTIQIEGRKGSITLPWKIDGDKLLLTLHGNTGVFLRKPPHGHTLRKRP